MGTKTGAVPRLSRELEHVALLLEAVLAELRLMGGLKERDARFINGSADYDLYLDELQEKRRALFAAG